MSDGYQKQRLTNYLAGANEDAIGAAGYDWRLKGRVLQAVSEALQKEGPTLAEKLGKDSKTAAELKTALLSAGASMTTTATKLVHAGDALVLVGDNLEKARVSRKAMKTLVEPPPYTTPSYNGAQPTPDQIQQDADARAASNTKHNAYQSAHAGQEAEAAEITANLDQAFLSAIPPMMAIHGGPDPTAPNPPGDKDGPGTNVPPPGRRTRERGQLHRVPEAHAVGDEETDKERREREERERERWERERAEREQREQMERERDRQRELAERERLEQERLERERLERERLERERLERERLEHKDPIHTTKSPTTNVGGGTDSGASYTGVSDGSSVSSSAGSTSAGVGGAAAAGAAGAGLGAGAMKGGAIGGSAAAPVGGTVRGIGAGGQSASSLSRGSTAAGSPSRAATAASAGARGGSASGTSGTSAASRSTAAGSSASRSAGAGGRAGAAGSTSSNRGAVGKGGAGRGSAGRSGAVGSTSGKGSSKGRSKGLFRRGSNGSTSGGRSNKSDDERNAGRDALVYEQDWLGDETAAPSVLD